MTTLKASRLQAVLDKARNTGQAEETFTLAGLEVTVRSLTPEDYTRISEELEDVSEAVYGHQYQQAMVSRALIGIEGEDFRDVDFIEVEKIDPASRQPVTVKVERHQWMLDNIVKTWSSATVLTAFKKVMETIDESEKRSVDGVVFRLESETDEDKFRRILSELQEAGAALPGDMREAILKSNGLLEATSQQELESLNTQSKEWLQRSASEQQATQPQEPPRAPTSLVQAAEPLEEEESQEEASELSVEERMATRVPLNREAIQPPVPVPSQAPTRAANARSPAPPPEQVHTLQGRSLEVAQLEGFDPNMPPQVLPGRAEPEILEPRPAAVTSVGKVSSNFEVPKPSINTKYVDPKRRPPAQGLNPRARTR